MQSAVLKWFGSRARGGIALLEQRVLLAGGIRAAVGAIVRVFRRRQELLTAGVGRSYGGEGGIGAPGDFPGQAGPGPERLDGAVVSLFLAGRLDEMSSRSNISGCYDV